MKSYVDQWRTIRKGFSKLMEVNDRIGEAADYKEQDVVNCEWSKPKAIQEMGWVSEETAQRWSKNGWTFYIKSLNLTTDTRAKSPNLKNGMITMDHKKT